MPEQPPIDDWAHQAALMEVFRIARGLRDVDFERDVRPRLTRLTSEQRVILEDGLVRLEDEEP